MSEFKAVPVEEINGIIKGNSLYSYEKPFYVLSEYEKLLAAYTTTRAELDKVKAELERGKWISVSERLPVNDTRVMIGVNNMTNMSDQLAVPFVAYGYYQDGKFFTERAGLINATHWLEVPQLKNG